ncbi:hypothetical protein EB75_19625 [Mycobacterium sp. ST-F2]|nr:hypothetical protein EB75_19625 [Mycobacterium sp. ST-F2]
MRRRPVGLRPGPDGFGCGIWNSLRGNLFDGHRLWLGFELHLCYRLRLGLRLSYGHRFGFGLRLGYRLRLMLNRCRLGSGLLYAA